MYAEKSKMVRLRGENQERSQGESMENMTNAINETMVKIGIFSGPIAKILAVLAVLIIGLIVIRVLLKLLKKGLGHSKLDEVLHKFIVNCAKVFLAIFLVMVILSVLGISMAPFVTVLGTCGAAVALALKDSLSNFAGGILIIINKPFSRGDFIEVGGVSGKVHEIDLMSSKLVTLDNKIITIPNGMLSTDTVINYSEQTTRRLDCVFGIGYDSDIRQAKEVIEKVISDSDFFMADPAPVIGVKELADSAIIIEVLAWCPNAQYAAAKYYLNEQVKLALDGAGVEIPYPNMTVHISNQQ